MFRSLVTLLSLILSCFSFADGKEALKCYYEQNSVCLEAELWKLVETPSPEILIDSNHSPVTEKKAESKGRFRTSDFDALSETSNRGYAGLSISGLNYTEESIDVHFSALFLVAGAYLDRRNLLSIEAETLLLASSGEHREYVNNSSINLKLDIKSAYSLGVRLTHPITSNVKPYLYVGATKVKTKTTIAAQTGSYSGSASVNSSEVEPSYAIGLLVDTKKISTSLGYKMFYHKNNIKADGIRLTSALKF